MTAGRQFTGQCGRCRQEVTFETTGFPYGPLVQPLRHNRVDGTLCAEEPVLFELGPIDVQPMKEPKGLLFDVEYIYGKL